MGRPKKVRGVCMVDGCEGAEAKAGKCRNHYMAAWRRARSPKRSVDAKQWSAEIVAWAAGLLDAGGSFVCKEVERGKRQERVIRIRFASFSEDLIVRLHKNLGIGTLNGKPFRGKYAWVLSQQQHIRALCVVMRPWMSALRQKQIDKFLEAIPEEKSDVAAAQGRPFAGEGDAEGILATREPRSADPRPG